MGKFLAIKGHQNRGEEVIEILEMLGGKKGIFGGGNTNFIYYIKPSHDYILVEDINNCNLNEFTIFTLEEFLEKNPFKVGDKVYHKTQNLGDSIYVIEKMRWENNQIKYIICNTNDKPLKIKVTTESLQHYKEELRQERKYPELRMDLDDDDKLATEVVIGGDKILPPNGYLIGKITQVDNGMLIEFVKKQPQYPKTYEECCEVISINRHDVEIDIPQPYQQNMFHFFKLLICRDAYWKIAGEEMGLSESWKPDWSNHQQKKYTIHFYQNQLTLTQGPNVSYILAFPTKEMRDFFAENFNDLIMKCRDFL